MIRGFQNATFNRTGRRKIPVNDIESVFENTKVRITRLRSEGWREGLTDELLEKAQVHFDISSLLYHVRETKTSAKSVLDETWPGLEVPLPPELIEGKYRVKLQVTIVLPPENGDGGRMLAQSAIKVVVTGEGDETGDEGGKSLLPVKLRHSMSELWRLQFTGDGNSPILFVNADIEGLSFRELATHSAFKYGILPGVLRLIYFKLAFAEPDTASWEGRWLRLPGVAGRARPDLEDLEFTERIASATEWADEVVTHLSTKMEVISKFARKWNAERTND